MHRRLPNLPQDASHHSPHPTIPALNITEDALREALKVFEEACAEGLV